MRRAVPLLAVVVAGLAAFAGCPDEPNIVALCQDDQRCIDDHGGNPNWACDPLSGECVCTADEACTGEREYCEPLPGGDGRCHPQRTCVWNPDCPGGFCDTTSRFCRQTGCEKDLQCSFGQVCDAITRNCVDGCRSHGDCESGQTCLCLDDEGAEVPCVCDGVDDEDRSACEIGVCAAGTCADKTFCKYGDLCAPGDEEGERAACVRDDRGPYCLNCINQPGSTACGSDGPNFCLIDTSDPAGRASFCGVDCSERDQECPNGFSCHDVLILTQNTCRGDAQCVPTGEQCRGDEECPAGSRCAKAEGQEFGRCGGRCAVGEGDQSGFCTCVTDSDCPQQACGADGRCSISRKRCVPGQDDTCRGADRIVCVNNGELGYCMIGRNCAPDEGITCADVRCAQDPSGCQ